MLDIKVDNMSFGNITCPPDWRVEEKGAIFYRVYYVLGGSAIYQDGHVRHGLVKDHIYLMPANQVYSVAHDPRWPLQCLWFHFTTVPAITTTFTSMEVSISSPLFFSLKTLEAVVGSGEFEKRDTLINKLLEGMLLIINKQVGLILQNDERLERALDYIKEHYDRKIKTTELAALISFDPFYFTRIFKKNFNVSPQNYIAEFRFNKATVMLLRGMPVSKVAEKLGFQDTKAFSRAFKKVKGMTPSECRKSQYLQP